MYMYMDSIFFMPFIFFLVMVSVWYMFRPGSDSYLSSLHIALDWFLIAALCVYACMEAMRYMLHLGTREDV